MNPQTLKSDGLLLIAAIIWGTTFVAQRVGMEYLGPFTFNGIRFALGSIVLLPLILWNRKTSNEKNKKRNPVISRKTKNLAVGLSGLILFGGSAVQQVGLIYTTAGKAGFITGLYVIIVPILGLFWRQKPGVGTWIGAIIASYGLYLLSISKSFTIDFGDLLILICAFIFSTHVLIIGWLSPRMDTFKLAFSQNLICSFLSLIIAFIFEFITISNILKATIPFIWRDFIRGYSLHASDYSPAKG